MKYLTMKGFLTGYVKRLSSQNTTSIYKLTKEVEGSNPRLKEPLFLYAVFSGKQDILLKALRNSPLYKEASFITSKPESTLREMFESESSVLPEAYHKVWHTYLSRKNCVQADLHTKELIRQKIIGLQEKKGISSYKIYTNLNVNPGNLNYWLKHGDGRKVSLDVAREALSFAGRETISN